MCGLSESMSLGAGSVIIAQLPSSYERRCEGRVSDCVEDATPVKSFLLSLRAPKAALLLFVRLVWHIAAQSGKCAVPNATTMSRKCCNPSIATPQQCHSSVPISRGPCGQRVEYGLAEPASCLKQRCRKEASLRPTSDQHPEYDPA